MLSDSYSVGLPLIMYVLSTRGARTPRKRAVATRPRTFNYYCMADHPFFSFILTIS
jgi:hypothetical protein